MKYPKKLNPQEADKLYHRYMQVKDGDGVCKHSICPATLAPTINGQFSCRICEKLFGDQMDFKVDDINKDFVGSSSPNFKLISMDGCPCDSKLANWFILKRVKQALEEFYGEEL